MPLQLHSLEERARLVCEQRQHERRRQLRALSLGGEPLSEGEVFLKGNQRNGTAMVRAESGLGLGILISGQAPSNPDAEDTWGPLPLDFFAD